MDSKLLPSTGWIYKVNIFATVLLILIPTFIETQAVLVQTKSGPVEGILLEVSPGRTINTFYSIPYAQPPGRFQPPERVKPWNATLKADKPLPPCYQQSLVGFGTDPQLLLLLQRPWSEDCLTLNIWTPNPKPEKAPVVAFIHGGAFVMGSSLWLTDGTTLALEGIVVVTMNYRLGAFGFFNLGVGEAPGNVGLMDQNVALQWIKQNIEAFGGDTESITLAGMSAGSASVGYHLLSPKSEGLFHRAIMMSGVPTNNWAINEPEKSIALSKSLAEALGCSSPNSSVALSCLKQIHPEDIRDATVQGNLANNFVPTIDGEFITEHPSISVIRGSFHPGAVILGTAADEGGEFMRASNPSSFRTRDGRLSRKEFLKVIKRATPGLSDLQVEALNAVYTKWSNPDDPLMLRDAAKDLYGDATFICGINEFAKNLARAGNSVYRYVFDHKMEIPGFSVSEWVRATHGADQLPVLGPFQVISQALVSPTDIAVSKRFLGYFVNFARNGDPNSSEDEFLGELHWPEYVSELEYNFISANSSIRKGPRTEECAAWLELLPLLQGKDTC